MARKSFKTENPALNFMSAQQEGEALPEPTAIVTSAHDREPGKASAPSPDLAAEGVPDRVPAPTANRQETKSKRLNLLIQPSLMEALHKLAHMQQTSVNHLIHTVLRDFCDGQQETVARFDELFGPR